jgi:hypothetical protein
MRKIRLFIEDMSYIVFISYAEQLQWQSSEKFLWIPAERSSSVEEPGSQRLSNAPVSSRSPQSGQRFIQHQANGDQNLRLLRHSQTQK